MLIGKVDQNGGIESRTIACPLALSQFMQIVYFGRAHIDVAMNVRLAASELFETLAYIRCNRNEIRLETNGGVISRWIHWYTNWEPINFRELVSTVGSYDIDSTF